MHFSKNIKLLRKRQKRTQEEIAAALKMKRSTLSGYENEVSQPTLSALLAFSKYYGVAIDTLLQVDLNILNENQLAQLERGGDVYLSGKHLRVLATTVSDENEENIELVPEKAKAGYVTGYADPEYIKELPVFQLPFLSKQKKYRTFQISGDSMLPIPHGAWITGEYLQDWQTISDGDACIFITLDEGIVFKVVENLLKKEKKFRLYSLNPLYEPFDLPATHISEVWKFAHYISDEIPDPLIPQEELLKTVASLQKDMVNLKKRVMKR